jgi:hypothetical protein
MPPPEPETRITVLGTVTVDPDKAIDFVFPADATAEEIAEALVVAEAKRVADAVEESRKLRELFLKQVALDDD